MTKIINLLEWVINLLSKFPQSLLALMARLIVGLQFLQSGLKKFNGDFRAFDVFDGNFNFWDGNFKINENSLFLFENEFTGVPLPFELSAYMAGYSEVMFSLLLIFGVATRFGALGLLGMTAVIQVFVYPEAYTLHGLWAIGLLYIIKYGPCVFSIDYIVKKLFRK